MAVKEPFLVMSFPTETTVLIVGAGPAGLVCALSLLQHGISDFVIVDAVEHWQQSSRSLIVHAATLEVCQRLLNALEFVSSRVLRLLNRLES